MQYLGKFLLFRVNWAFVSTLTDNERINDRPKDSAAIELIGSDNRESMNDELAKVLKLYREKNHNWDIHKTPEIFIQPTSSSANVKQWLKAKGFSDYVVTKFGYLNGHELFSLDRETLEEHCGAEEGKRLLSQITVQRNISGVSRTSYTNIFPVLAFCKFISFFEHSFGSWKHETVQDNENIWATGLFGESTKANWWTLSGKYFVD